MASNKPFGWAQGDKKIKGDVTGGALGGRPGGRRRQVPESDARVRRLANLPWREPARTACFAIDIWAKLGYCLMSS